MILFQFTFWQCLNNMLTVTFFFFFFNDTVLKLSSEGIDMNMGNFLKVHCEARVLETTANRLMCSR